MTLSEMVKAIYDKLISGQSAPLGYYLYTTASFETTAGSSGSVTVDLSGYANYAGLTDENFAYLTACKGNYHMANSYNGKASCKPSSYTYSPSSGKLTITFSTSYNFQNTTYSSSDIYIGCSCPIIVPTISE